MFSYIGDFFYRQINITVSNVVHENINIVRMHIKSKLKYRMPSMIKEKWLPEFLQPHYESYPEYCNDVRMNHYICDHNQCERYPISSSIVEDLKKHIGQQCIVTEVLCTPVMYQCGGHKIVCLHSIVSLSVPLILLGSVSLIAFFNHK